MKRIEWNDYKDEIFDKADHALGDVKYTGIIIVDQESACNRHWTTIPNNNCFRPSYPITDLK